MPIRASASARLGPTPFRYLTEVVSSSVIAPRRSRQALPAAPRPFRGEGGDRQREQPPAVAQRQRLAPPSTPARLRRERGGRRPPFFRIRFDRHETALAATRGGITIDPGREAQLGPPAGVEPQCIGALASRGGAGERHHDVLRLVLPHPAPHQRKAIRHLVRQRREPLPSPLFPTEEP